MITEEQIRELAHSIWEQEGRPNGKDVEHYFRAKKMLEEQKAVSLAANKLVSPALTPQPSSEQKPGERHAGKLRSKKVV